MEPLLGWGWDAATRVGDDTAASVVERKAQRMCQQKGWGKVTPWPFRLPPEIISRSGELSSSRPLWIDLVTSPFCFYFFRNGSLNTLIWDVLVKRLKLQGREREHQSASALSCRELSSVILSGLAGEGQRDPKGSPRTRRQVRYSQAVLWEGHVLGPQFLQLWNEKNTYCSNLFHGLEEKYSISATVYYSNVTVKSWCLYCKMIFKTWSIRMVTEIISIKLFCFCPVTLILQSKIVLWAFIRFYEDNLSFQTLFRGEAKKAPRCFLNEKGLRFLPV